jgi:hypothetical protein
VGQEIDLAAGKFLSDNPHRCGYQSIHMPALKAKSLSEQIAVICCCHEAATLAGFGFDCGTSVAVAAAAVFHHRSGKSLERTEQAAALSEHGHLLTVRGSGHASGE